MGKAAVAGSFRGATHPFCDPTGVMVTACLYKENGRNTGGPSGGDVRQPDTREGQAGPCGASERFIVPMKSGNADGGKGPHFGNVGVSVKSRESGHVA
jgi:hypothetical protein